MEGTALMDRKNNRYRGGGAGGVYVMGLVGALVYYIQQADGFWSGVWGVVQAIFWPGFLVYHVLKFVAA
jgi:hypothetical protein